MSPCTNKISFKIDITCIPFNFRGEKETLISYKPEYCDKEGRRARKHRVITGQQPGTNGIRRERNTSITKRRAGHKGKGGKRVKEAQCSTLYYGNPCLDPLLLSPHLKIPKNISRMPDLEYCHKTASSLIVLLCIL